MASSARPFVGIVGGFYNLKSDPAVFDEAKKTAREIGAALAAAGMGLVVYFSDDESLEPHVVAGYVKALPAGAGQGSIRVRYAQSQRDVVKFAEQTTRKDAFELNLFPSDDWEAPFYRSLVAADGVDAVLLMAGARSTLIAGQIAVARPLPILAIDKFDGSAGVIRTELAITARDYPSAATHSITEMRSTYSSRQGRRHLYYVYRTKKADSKCKQKPVASVDLEPSLIEQLEPILGLHCDTISLQHSLDRITLVPYRRRRGG